MSRYSHGSKEAQGEVLPNKLGITDLAAIQLAETEGFYAAGAQLLKELTPQTQFNPAYICQIHQLALQALYGFAGQYRTVNISKGGFPFPAAMQVPKGMLLLDKEMLSVLPSRFDKLEDFIVQSATIHAELLYLHPFREGNGRTARLLTFLMAQKFGFDEPEFGIASTEEGFQAYVRAVQQAGQQRYGPMISLFRQMYGLPHV